MATTPGDDDRRSDKPSRGVATDAAATPAAPTADLCDFALSELDSTRSRVESATRTTYKPQTTAQRAGSAVKALVGGAASFAAAAVAAPAKVVSFYATTSRADRKVVYAGWWTAAKAEARHYWAGLKLLGAEVRIAARLVSAAPSPGYGPVIYMLAHLAATVASLCLASVWWRSQVAHSLFIVALISASAYNGATYYLDSLLRGAVRASARDGGKA